MPKRSGWIAARALFRAPDGRRRQAHTSPIYVVVDGKLTASSEDARYMLRWIDRLTEIAETQSNRYPNATAKRTVLATYDEAKACYGQVIQNAKRYWDD